MRQESGLRIFKQIRPLFFIFIVVAFIGPGCALRNQALGKPAPVASVAPVTTPRCSDRVDRARTGSLVGSVLGTIAASGIGSPFLGIFYKTAGYVMGFATDSPCPKANPPTDASKAVEKADSSPASSAIEEELL